MILLNEKLKGIPTIYYTNLDHRVDRREYMESQFNYWGITNYHRISSSKYRSTEEYKWQHLILDNKIIFGSAALANSITQIEMIKNWLDTTDEENLIIMEDDYDLSLIEYWNFDWEYLMDNIPENWDCIQLGFENSCTIPFYLHPTLHNHGFGPCLINRDYAKKIIKLHYFNGKFKLNIKTNDVRYSEYYGMVDSFILEDGKSYSLPLITNNPDLGSDYDLDGIPVEWHKKCRDLYYDWWKNEHQKYTLNDFFTYGQPDKFKMIKKVEYEESTKSISTFAYV